MTYVVSIIGGSTATQRSVEATLANRLQSYGIKTQLCSRTDRSAFNADLIITQYPLPVACVPPEARILGQRILDRKHSLLAAQDANSTVARWASPENAVELHRLCKEWGTQRVVIKYGWSTQRNGVFLLRPGSDFQEDLPIDYDPRSDICMEFLGADPTTYKADLFCGSVLACWALKTRSMEYPDWHSVTQPIALFVPPKKTVDQLKRLSTHLIRYGTGYMSVDLMRFEGELKIIEVNTCRVATQITWSRFPDLYATSYARALRNILPSCHLIPAFGDLNQHVERYQQLRGTSPVSMYVDGEPALRGQNNVNSDRRTLLSKLYDELRSSSGIGRQQLHRNQRVAAKNLFFHAVNTVPFYRKRLHSSRRRRECEIDCEEWQSIPLLRVRDLHNKRIELISRAIPAKHGLTTHRSIVSTQGLITVTTTMLADCMNVAMSMRNLDWNDIDATEAIACILRQPRAEQTTMTSDERGPRPVLTESVPAQEQLNWLLQSAPAYLQTSPENLRSLVGAIRQSPDTLRPRLSSIITTGKPLQDSFREDCRDILQCEVTDAYAPPEVGYCALRCQHGIHHVQTEHCLVELLDGNDQPCQDDETGQIIVTALLATQSRLSVLRRMILRELKRRGVHAEAISQR